MPEPLREALEEIERAHRALDDAGAPRDDAHRGPDGLGGATYALAGRIAALAASSPPAQEDVLREVIEALERGYHPQNPSHAHPADFVRVAFEVDPGGLSIPEAERRPARAARGIEWRVRNPSGQWFPVTATQARNHLRIPARPPWPVQRREDGGPWVDVPAEGEGA